MSTLARGQNDKANSATVVVIEFRNPRVTPTFQNGPRIARAGDGLYQGGGKHVLDIILASAMLVCLAPLIGILALFVALDGGSPFFGHARVGRGGRSFRCLKIRSMRTDAERELARVLAENPDAAEEWARNATLTNDPRVTRFGAFLRKSGLDDLPQLINVLRGEMSLVGPRPVTREELDRYGAAVISYLAVKPGLIGPWQIDDRNEISYDDRVALDAAYVRGRGFWRDVDIMARTGLSLLKLTGK